MQSPPSRIVIVGSGMVSARLCAALHQHAPGRFTVTVLGEERRPDPCWYAEHGVVLHAGDPVASIDHNAATVTTANGWVARYDHLVMASELDAHGAPGAHGAAPLAGADADAHAYATADLLARRLAAQATAAQAYRAAG